MSVEQALRTYLEKTKGSLIQQMKFQDFYASGKTANSLEVQVTGNKGELLGGEAVYYMIYGRGPGKMPPVEAIAAWVKSRALDISPWAVAKHIAKYGTAVFQGKRKPLEFAMVVGLHRDELLKNLGEHYRDLVITKIQQAKK